VYTLTHSLTHSRIHTHDEHVHHTRTFTLIYAYTAHTHTHTHTAHSRTNTHTLHTLVQTHSQPSVTSFSAIALATLVDPLDASGAHQIPFWVQTLSTVLAFGNLLRWFSTSTSLSAEHVKLSALACVLAASPTLLGWPTIHNLALLCFAYAVGASRLHELSEFQPHAPTSSLATGIVAAVGFSFVSFSARAQHGGEWGALLTGLIALVDLNLYLVQCYWQCNQTIMRGGTFFFFFFF
jgi:hypothetical protein